jgi:hypothetical protein
MLMSFSDTIQSVSAAGGRLLLATHDTVTLAGDGSVVLPPLSGALIESAA